MRLLLKAWSVAAVLSCAVAATQYTELVISNADVAPDGYSRPAIVVNGTTPGPPITANKGDILQVNVQNQLSDPSMNTSTSVHWHGIFLNHSNAYDGTAFVTQCPIVPGASFLYEVNVAAQSGAYWYHSHYNLQYCDGLRGPIIIYDPEDPYAYLYDVDDVSTIISLMDWYHSTAYNIGTKLPAGILVNGKGRYADGPSTMLSVTNVTYGKRYRLRLINMACRPIVSFSIDSHSLTIIEADGQATVPYTVDIVSISPGQRYSVILEATQSVDNYWIRAMPGNYPSNFMNGLNSAILRYAGASEEEPIDRSETHIWEHSRVANSFQVLGLESTLTAAPQPEVAEKNPEIPFFSTVSSTQGIVFDESQLQALDNPAAPGLPYPGGADVSIDLVGTMNATALRFSINGYSYNPPTVPTLLQILSGAKGIADLAKQGSVYTLPTNKVIEISFPTTFIPTPHPFHLHGHSFSVVRSAGSTEYNYVNPVRRDTVNIGYGGDNVTIRFVTDNTGPWILHCHIDFHLEMGMAIVFAENPNGTAVEDPVNDSWKALCPAYDNLVESGNPT